MPRIEYEQDDKGNITLPDGLPFSGESVLIKTQDGWVEAWWCELVISNGPDGMEYEGFEWVCLDDKFTLELEQAEEWMPLPEPIKTRPTMEDILNMEPINEPILGSADFKIFVKDRGPGRTKILVQSLNDESNKMDFMVTDNILTPLYSENL